MMAGVEHAELLFNVVFLSTIISLLVQGTTVSGMANLLGLAYEERESAFNVEMHEEMKSALTEVEVNENLLASGHTLKEHHPAREYAGDDGSPRRGVLRAAGEDGTQAGRQAAGYFLIRSEELASTL